jgi:hypothetical protein
VPSTNDEIGFFRAIAKSLGVSINLNSKAHELRQRIEQVLQGGDLMLVLDEAHYLWPNSSYREALPSRVNWILTALVNYGVPVALIATPQFIKTQKLIESRSCWTSEQFWGRVGHFVELPASVTEKDLFSVARALMPEGDEISIEYLVRYAQASCKYLAAIDSAVKRARFVASRSGRAEPGRADIKKAVSENLIPSDSAITKALEAPAARRGRKLAPPVVTAEQPSFSREVTPRTATVGLCAT